MKLSELKAQLVRYESRPDGEHMVTVQALAEAQGVMFLCPKCFAENGGSAGTHRVIATFAGRGALDHQGSHDKDGKPTRWQVEGTGLEDLTLKPSVHIFKAEEAVEVDTCGWHGWVNNGDAT